MFVKTTGPEGDVLKVTWAELQTLEANGWLCGDVINEYFRLIVKRSRRGVGRRVAVLSTYLAEKITRAGLESVGGWYAASQEGLPASMEQIELFLCPILVHGNHWVLFVIDLAKRRTFWYDSLGAPVNRTKRKEILGYVRKLTGLWLHVASTRAFRACVSCVCCAVRTCVVPRTCVRALCRGAEGVLLEGRGRVGEHDGLADRGSLLRRLAEATEPHPEAGEWP